MRTKDEIHESIITNFEKEINDDIQKGSAIDLFSSAIAKEYEELYEELEKSRTPHVWTYLEGEYIDKAASGLNLVRANGETDETFKYRFSKWVLQNEASNNSAIEVALLNLTYASYAEFVPYTKGAGTGTVYVIPLHYEKEIIENALTEAKDAIKNVISPGVYVEYLTPEVLAVKFQIMMKVSGLDTALLKTELEDSILEYVNNIAPNDYLEVGEVNKIGMNIPGVNYFNVTGLYLNDEIVSDTRILQNLETKMLFDEIVWIIED